MRSTKPSPSSQCRVCASIFSLTTALQSNAVLGSAGEGRISLAARADYVEAAAAVLVADDQAGRGLPEVLAAMLAHSDSDSDSDADADAGAADGALFDDGRTLSTLIGHPTTPMSDTIKAFISH